jgi:DNA polymerase-1
MGDAVDNIPGVPGVGPKTAAGLLKDFGSVENLLGRLDEVKSEKLRQSLRAAESDIRRNQKLVRLPDVQCEFAAENLRVQPADVPSLRVLLTEWGFRGLLDGLSAGQEQAQAELI